MEINPENSFVRCPSCGDNWHIKASNYYCSCNYIFSADDVKEEIDAIVINAKLIAKELQRSASTWNRIESYTNREIEIKAENTIKKSFGAKVWDALKGVLPTIVKAVRAWMGI